MSVVTDSELVEIVTELVGSTKEGLVKWRIFEEEDSREYAADTSRFTYYIKSRDEDDLAPYRFQIFKKIDSTSRMVLEHTTRPESTTAGPLGLLYGTAKLSAFGIKSLKDEVLGDLGTGS